jgi:hypothetical protein
MQRESQSLQHNISVEIKPDKFSCSNLRRYFLRNAVKLKTTQSKSDRNKTHVHDMKVETTDTAYAKSSLERNKP